MGCGIRVVAGEQTGYAYTDDLAPEKIMKAAKIAARIASGPARVSTVGLSALDAHHDFYPVALPSTDRDLSDKLELVVRADVAARASDPRIKQVRATYGDQIRHVLIAGSDGRVVTDFQPLVRLNVFTIAQDGSKLQSGSSGGGGRVGLEFFSGERSPEHFAKEAARQAIVQLEAREAPAGEMEVVLGPGWPGILLHEAIGHGLEADFNRKGISAFSGKMGQRVASDICTVVDDGTIPARRGSLNVDDEGEPTQKTVLIENGILRAYLQDKLSSDILKTTRTGNGRRESYEHIPMPRMTNTYMLAGHGCSGRYHSLRQTRAVRGQFWRRAGGHHQRQVCVFGVGSLPDRGWPDHLAGEGRHADRRRPHGADPSYRRGQRSETRSGNRHLRKGWPKRAGGSGYSHHQSQQPHGGRNGSTGRTVVCVENREVRS